MVISNQQENIIKSIADSSVKAITMTIESNLERLDLLSQWITTSINKGGKLLLFGNGGSAADAQHIAAEFVNRFLKERKPLPAISLSTDTSILTAVSNDYDFDQVFSKQIAAIGKQEDIALGISTSGNSPNVLKAIELAKEIGIKTAALTGNTGGQLAEVADLAIISKSNETPRIQETHILMGHILCELVENNLFP